MPTDLVTVDGEPVGVAANGIVDADGAADPEALDAAERGGLVSFRQCDDSPVAVGRGSTRVDTADGVGLDVDQLVLSSVPDPGNDGDVDGDAVGPALRVSNDGPISYSAMPTESTTEPYWLVLGQSNNAGWHLTVDGQDLGESTLVNGYANGWYIDPAKVGDSPTFELEWSPQQPVWFALLLSALGFVLCLVLAARPAKPAVRGTDHPLHPVGLPWLDAFGRPVAWVPTALATAGAAVGGAVFIGPLWGVPTALAMVVALRTALGWRVLRFATIGAMGLAASYVVAKQWRNDYPLDFDWPQHFEAIHSLGMFAYALLAVECLVEALRAGWRRDANIDADD